MSPRKKTEAAAPEAPDFETALNRLQEIVRAMEQGELSLERMMESFEEGRRLADLCNRKLREVERRIEVLLQKGDEWVAEPFEPGGAGPPAGPEGGAPGTAPSPGGGNRLFP